METSIEFERLLKFAEQYSVEKAINIETIRGYNNALLGYDFDANRLIYSVKRFIEEIESTYHIFDEEAYEFFAENYFRQNNVTWCYDAFR